MSKEKKNKKEEKAKLVEMETSTTNEMVISVKGEEGRSFRFTMPFYAPLPECYNASLNIANKIAELFNEAIEKQKAKAEADAKEEKKEEEKKDN